MLKKQNTIYYVGTVSYSLNGKTATRLKNFRTIEAAEKWVKFQIEKLGDSCTGATVQKYLNRGYKDMWEYKKDK